MDTVDRATRSHIMARIRSKNTLPERCLRAALAQAGLHGWRMWARDYWAAKFARNRKVFARSRAELRARGWLVIEVLENEARCLPGIVARALAAALKIRRAAHKLSTGSPHRPQAPN